MIKKIKDFAGVEHQIDYNALANLPSDATSTVAGLMPARDKRRMDCTIPHYYGTCDTASIDAAKVVSIKYFELVVGVRVTVKFTNATGTDVEGDALTMNVSGTGALPMRLYGIATMGTNTTTTGWTAGAIQTFTYDGNAWVREYWNNTTYSNVSLGQGYATCSTAATTKAKKASLSSYALTVGGIVSVRFSYDVPAGATLNINSKGAKAIYYNNAAITDGVIKAGDTATFIYSTYYRLIAIDRGNTVTADRALISNSSGKMAASDVTATELGYLDGVTSNVQTQLNAKAEIFVVNFNINGNTVTPDKTLIEICDAHDAGKLCIGYSSEWGEGTPYYLYVADRSSGEYQFINFYGSGISSNNIDNHELYIEVIGCDNTGYYKKNKSIPFLEGATFTGNVTLKGDPTSAMHAATKQYVDNSKEVFIATYGTTTYDEIKAAYDAGKVCFCKNGSFAIAALGQISSQYAIFSIATQNSSTIYTVTKTNAWSLTTHDNLPKAGGTMTGALTLASDPTNAMHAATKQYVDNNALTLESVTASMPSARSWRVTYGNGRFVAVGYNSMYGAYSDDGITWTEVELPFIANWTDIAYGMSDVHPSLYMAIAYNSNEAIYSEDGITWTECALPVSSKWRGVCHGIIDGGINGFIAVSSDGVIAKFDTSQLAWSQITNIPNGSWYGVAYGNGKFVAVNSTDNQSPIITSEDGNTWTANSSSYSTSYSYIDYGNGMFVAAGNSGSFGVSWDGINWKHNWMTDNYSSYTHRVIYGNGKFLAIPNGANRTHVRYTEDGFNWTIVALPQASSMGGVAYGHGKFVIVGQGNTSVLISPDCENWFSEGYKAKMGNTDVTAKLKMLI